jgi:hypothetical protein
MRRITRSTPKSILVGARRRCRLLEGPAGIGERQLQHLYKYLPNRFADDFVRRGILLFRTLSYFQKVEDPERGDPFESMHIDRPGDGVSITNQRTGKTLTGEFAFINRVQSDQIFCFCFSRIIDSRLFAQFQSDVRIEIKDLEEFQRRWQGAVQKFRSTNAALQRLVGGPCSSWQSERMKPSHAAALGDDDAT